MPKESNDKTNKIVILYLFIIFFSFIFLGWAALIVCATAHNWLKICWYADRAHTHARTATTIVVRAEEDTSTVQHKIWSASGCVFVSEWVLFSLHTFLGCLFTRCFFFSSPYLFVLLIAYELAGCHWPLTAIHCHYQLSCFPTNEQKKKNRRHKIYSISQYQHRTRKFTNTNVVCLQQRTIFFFCLPSSFLGSLLDFFLSASHKFDLATIMRLIHFWMRIIYSVVMHTMCCRIYLAEQELLSRPLNDNNNDDDGDGNVRPNKLLSIKLLLL